MRTKRPLDTGKTVLRDLTSNILCTRPFTPVRIISSQATRFAVIVISVKAINTRFKREFHTYSRKIQLQTNPKALKIEAN